ncbi:MAG: hypothetical protein IPO25_19945 [Saprospiraceae bacterium]|nr:hypothetical protein [Saprospiraceae bacterium]
MKLRMMHIVRMMLIGWLLTMMACNKSMVETTVDCPLAPNQSVLVRKGCEAYVFALTQKSVDSEAEWTDIFSKKKYQNAISVLNYCDGSVESLLLQDLQVGDKVLMDLTPTQDRCLILCFAFEDAPKFGYNAKNISLCSQ